MITKLFKEFNNSAFTIEFFKSNNRILVDYNRKIYSLINFLRLPETKYLINIMYKYIMENYKYDWIMSLKNKKNVIEIVGEFIKNHFIKYTKKLDVFITNNGKNVKFNVEE